MQPDVNADNPPHRFPGRNLFPNKHGMRTSNAADNSFSLKSLIGSSYCPQGNLEKAGHVAHGVKGLGGCRPQFFGGNSQLIDYDVLMTFAFGKTGEVSQNLFE